MKRTQLALPGALARILNAAQDALKQKDLQQGAELLDRASRLDPSNANILIRLGRLHGLLYDYDTAERCFGKALRLSGNKTAAMATIASLAAEFADHRVAEQYFQRTLEQKDAPPEAFAELAELYEHMARLDDTAKLVDRALALTPACAPALLVRARLERFNGRLEDSERTLRALIANAQCDVRVKAFYELGTVLDRQGRYDEAMSAFLEAKMLVRPQAAPFLAQLQLECESFKQRHSRLSAELFQRWHDTAASLGPPHRLSLVAGVPRSGTTLLEQVLDSHPEIVAAEETRIFVSMTLVRLRPHDRKQLSMLDVIESASIPALQQARADYFKFMERYLQKGVNGRLLVDKNPGINLSIPAFIRVFPETRLLVALRDPRDVCLSCFMQAYVPVTRNSASYTSIEKVVEGYAFIMGQWRLLAPMLKNPWMEVRYEDVVQDLETLARKVLDFLGVAWDAGVLRFNEHAQQRRVRSPSYADVTKPVFKTAVGRWRNYQKYFEPYLDKLKPFVKAFGYE
jgi:tetratricopeptide (TPR) repeat protein